MRFSRRVPSLVPNRMAEALGRLRRTGVPLIDLTCSNPTRVGLSYPGDLLAPLAGAGALTYEPDPLGHPAARAAVVHDLARLGIGLEPRHVLLTASTSEAYGFLFKLLCDPGDEVLVPQPSYPLFEHLTALDAVRAVPYALDPHAAWRIDAGAIDRAATSRTRAVLVVSPNNPTGSTLSPADLADVSGICARRQLALVGDEVFADYLFGDEPFTSVLHQESCLTFGLGGLSKTIGLPQVKLAWVAVTGPDALVRPALDRLELIGDTYLPVSMPVQLALPALFERGAAVREAIRRRLVENRNVLEATVARTPACSTVAPRGGWSAAIRVPAVRPEEDLALELLERHGVIVTPGYFFDFPAEAWLVVSLLGRPDEFAAGLSRLLEAAGA